LVFLVIVLILFGIFGPQLRNLITLIGGTTAQAANLLSNRARILQIHLKHRTAWAGVGSGVLPNAVQTSTSAEGKLIAINPDSTGGGCFDQAEVRTIYADKHTTIVVTDLNANEAEIRQATTTVAVDGLTRNVATDLDNNGVADRINTHVLVNNGDGSRVETTTDTGGKCVHISQSSTYSKWRGRFEVCRIGSNSNHNHQRSSWRMVS
jgi:hypothetical protein